MSKILILVQEEDEINEYLVMRLLSEGHGVLLVKSEGGRTFDRMWIDEFKHIKAGIIASTLIGASESLRFVSESIALQARREEDEYRKKRIGMTGISGSMSISNEEISSLKESLLKIEAPKVQDISYIPTRQNYKGEQVPVSSRNLRRKNKKS